MGEATGRRTRFNRLDGTHAGLRVNVRAALCKSFREDVSGAAVRTNPQHAVWKRLQQRCLNPEVGVDRRELGAGDAAADHRNPLGESLGVALTAAWTCNFSDPVP
jgi:hypothetical protein